MAKAELTESEGVELTQLSRDDLLEVVDQLVGNADLYEERLAELEAELDEVGWFKLAADTQNDLSREGLTELIRLCRVMYLKNPLIQHALEVQADYVWAQGASFTAPGPANDILQGFLSDRKNLTTFSSHAARIENDKRLGYEANIFFILFSKPENSHVTVRIIPVDEMLAGDIILNPDDRKEPWYYKRVWTKRTLNVETGEEETEVRTDYYPDWRYEEETRGSRPADRIRDSEIHWDAPVYHFKVGGLADGKWGVPTIWSAISWARSVTRDMEDFATIRHALARFVFQITAKGGGKAVGAAKRKFQSQVTSETPTDHNPPPATGSTFISSDLFQLSAVNRSGGEPDTEKGRGLRLMTSAGTGIPETILMGNADVGNLATAETLDRPTELKMLNRQTLWADVFSDICGFMLDFGAKNKKIPAEFTDESGETVEQSTKVEVAFPSVLEENTKNEIEALVNAATIGGKQLAIMSKKEYARQAFKILGLENIDELLEEMFPEGSEGTQPPGEVQAQPEEVPGIEPPPITVPDLAAPSQEAELLQTLGELRDAAKAAAGKNGRSHD